MAMVNNLGLDAAGSPDGTVVAVGDGSDFGGAYTFVRKYNRSGGTVWTQKSYDPALTVLAVDIGSSCQIAVSGSIDDTLTTPWGTTLNYTVPMVRVHGP